MSGWTTAVVGDPLLDADPFAAVDEALRACGHPDAWALTALVAGDLHCRAVAWFPPEHRALGARFDAVPCAEPARTGLSVHRPADPRRR